MEVSRYHKFLRVSAVLVAIILIFDGGFFTPISKQLSDNTVLYLAQGVGMSVGVEGTELSALTAELTKREQQLSIREAALNSRDIKARNFSSGDTVDYSTYILSVILFILTVLIVLNYAMDWVRLKQRTFASSDAKETA